MKNQSELGRREFVMDQIIIDSQLDLENNLIELEEVPESFINSVYETSYDEMSEEEKTESVEWVKEQLTSSMK